jgi:hypothetical protein
MLGKQDDKVEVLQRMLASGKIFSIEFIKRTTLEPRKMLCRGGVHSYLTGGGKKFEPSEKRLSLVFDMQAKGYRMVSWEGIVAINGYLLT